MLLMSVKPIYAKLIFEGRKKYEFRKKIPTLQYNSRVIVYASSRVRAIVGEFRVGNVYYMSIPDLWKLAKEKEGGVTKKQFFEYFRGYSHGYAIEILAPFKYPKELTLDEIRKVIPGFNPPVNFMRIKGKLKKVINDFLLNIDA
ncbi:MAG: ASCH domain-containing protein [Candidatus Asgardarchaeia archaeon]|nr:MAG: DNA-binding protein [Candidatus Asgardarchaeum californiense]